MTAVHPPFTGAAGAARPLSTAERILTALEQHGLRKLRGEGRYEANSPFRPGSNSHAFKLKITDDEHGAYFDWVSKETGSLYQLADALGLERPQQPAADTSSKRAYSDLTDYAQAHGAPVEAFTAAGWGEALTYERRHALPFTTPTGTRYRFIDGQQPPYKSPAGYQRCWYGLQRALHIAEATDQPLTICNGEASTVVAQHHGVAATAIAGGGENGIPENLLTELKEAYAGPIQIALDCDQAGHSGAMRMLGTLRVAGYTVRALDLNGHPGFDLADFARLHGNDTATALQGLQDLPASTPARRYLTEDEIDQLAPPAWLIKSVVPAGEVTLVSGAGDTGKTFLVLDMVKRVAQHYPVLYIAAEDASGIKVRKRAWELHHHLPKNGNFLLWPGSLPLVDASEVTHFIDEVRGLGLQMIVIDTLSQSIAGADENSSKDMTVVMQHCQAIARETSAAVVVIHHTTKNGDTYRGSSAIKNNTYAHLEVSRDDDLIKLECDRIKNAKPFAARYFKLVEVATDITDEAGAPLTSCVILPADRVTSSDRLTPNQLRMLETLLNITDATGGAATTELENATGLHGNSFYGALKRLRGLGLVDKGDRRTDPLHITSAGRARLATESSNPEYQASPGHVFDAAPPFEVNTRLGQFLPVATGSNGGSNVLLPAAGGRNATSNGLLPIATGSNDGSNGLLPPTPTDGRNTERSALLPFLDGSNTSSNVPQHFPPAGTSYPAPPTATTGNSASERPTTVATKLLPSATGSNRSLTTPSLSPVGEGGGSNGGSKGAQHVPSEPDVDHDQRREREIDQLLAQRKFKEARRMAAHIRGRKEQERVEAKIAEVEAGSTP